MKLANVVLINSIFFAFACSSTSSRDEAIAVMKTVDGKDLGNVTFTQEGDYTIVTTHLRNLPANSSHGFHIHEYGNCNGNFTGVGDHFNPDRKTHGGMNSAAHAGDLGNVETTAAGEVNVRFATNKFNVDEKTPNVLGRSLIIHAKKDDLHSSPAGNSGEKMGCGIIESI